MKLERTQEFEKAIAMMDEDIPFLFITGRAGTGKSTLLRQYILASKRRVPVLAPTGVAALNVGGETIHRFFRFSPTVTVKDAKREGRMSEDKLYRVIDSIIIDEISMVRADLLDCVDAFLRAARQNQKPFGGVRIVAIGDLYQLPPVVTKFDKEGFFKLYATPYFFSSRVVQELLDYGQFEFFELQKVYRQKDKKFLGFLNGIRDLTINDEGLAGLNKRLRKGRNVDDTIVLTPTNQAADDLNECRLAELSGKAHLFEGQLSGDFHERDAPAGRDLRLKKGARVMCTVNDSAEAYVNGSLGWVKGFEDDGVLVELDEGGTARIEKHTWNLYRSHYDFFSDSLEQEKIGSFTQYPLRLAWAITIHKSQGKTFDKVVIDLGRGAFAAGQVYVALSRCRSLEGLILTKPVTLRQVMLDPAIVDFLAELRGEKKKRRNLFDILFVDKPVEPVYVEDEG
ncbi:MAG: DEAD/DEAH box helicase [Patescibacteria group bacterium]